MRKCVVAMIVVLLPFAVAAQEVKDPGTPVGADGPLPRATGGPDGYGYVWHDQGEADVTYQWIEITSTGTLIGSGDDAGFPVTLDFDFELYGTAYSSMAFTTNGYLSTDPTDAGPDLSNDCPLPATPSTGGGARIYPLQDDLLTGSGGGLYYQYFATCPRPDNTGATPACMVFQWNGMNHFMGGGPFDLEVILYDNSYEIACQIGPGNPEAGSGSTTGIQNDDATIGLTYACDTANSVPDNTAVAFFVPGSAQPTPVPGVPAVSSWGLAAFLVALAGIAVLVLRRRA